MSSFRHFTAAEVVHVLFVASALLACVTVCPVRAQQRLSMERAGPLSPADTSCAASALQRNSMKSPTWT